MARWQLRPGFQLHFLKGMIVKWTLSMRARPRPYLFLLVALFLSFPEAAAAEGEDDINGIADKYQRIVGSALIAYSTQSSSQQPSLEQILDAIAGARSTAEKAGVLASVVSDLSALEARVDNPRFSRLVSFLLEQGVESTAEHFLRAVERHGSDYSLAAVRLAFAHHYATTARWDQAIQQLSGIAINTMLTPDDADHAHLLYGRAMQGKRLHREAVDFYRRIHAGSSYYWLAQLNTALAYLRQGWWTDAHVAIESALPAEGTLPDDSSDRLYSVLGYSQIEYGFYRRSRDSFRKVRVDGPYANRALLGLGLAALHQNDIVGALNAFDHLKDRDPNDISVAEAHLLSAFTLSQLGRTTSASAAYAEAIAFYQHYLARLEKSAAWLSPATIDAPDQLVRMMSTEPAAQLRFWVKRLQLVEYLSERLENPDTNTALLSLRSDIVRALEAGTREALHTRRQIIESYLNQANLGLATLYDSK